MALNNDDKKPEEVKKAEATGGQTFDPTTEKQLKPGDCVACMGEGLKNESQVCPVCAGTGKA